MCHARARLVDELRMARYEPLAYEIAGPGQLGGRGGHLSSQHYTAGRSSRGGGYGGYGMFGGRSGGMIRLPGQFGGMPVAPSGSSGSGTNQTGELLGETAIADPSESARGIRIVPDYINNLIVVQSTPQEWEIIRRTLEQLDFAPRQVLIDAQIYEVSLTGALSNGVSAFLRERSGDSQRKLRGLRLSGSCKSFYWGTCWQHT